MGNDVLEFINIMLWVNLFYAGICANILFGDLFNSRMCNALHAMPMRREGWLLTHLVSGILFSLIPNLLLTITLAVLLQQYFYIALLWLAAVSLQYLFFFGVGVFSVMCAGNRLGMAAMYGIINFLSLLVYVVADQCYEPLLYGIQFDSEAFSFFCPVVYLTRLDLANFDYGKITGGTWHGVYWDAWYYLFAIAIIGIVLLILSICLYRHRKLETAGDFIALRPLSPVFLVIYTLGVGVVMYSFTALFGINQSYLFLVVGIIIGFFTGKMLLERTVKVFRVKNLLGFVLFAVVLAGSLFVTHADPLDLTGYIPKAEDIQYLRVYDSSQYYLFEDPDDACWQFTDPDEIAYFQALHQELIDTGNESVGERAQIRFQYQLKDGSRVIRYYYVTADSEAGKAFNSYLSDYRYIFLTDDWESVLAHTAYVDMEYTLREEYRTETLSNAADIQQLLEAVKQDCDAGNIAQDWIFHDHQNYAGHICIQFHAPATSSIDYVYSVDITLYESCENTLQFLDSYFFPETAG